MQTETTTDTTRNLVQYTSATITNVDHDMQETAFNDAAAVVNEDAQGPDTLVEKFDELSSIIAFLERPTVLWQSRINSSSPVIQPLLSFGANPTTFDQKPIKTFVFPRDLMVVGNKWQKISNFKYFKADVRLRILINANPFIAGRLYITYSPVDSGEEDVTQLNQLARIEQKGRTAITSYPGVEIDLQTNTAAELTVPWLAKTEVASADYITQQHMRVDIWQLTPLLIADNSLSIPIQVYAAFSNIALKFPTPVGLPAPPASFQMAKIKREAKGPIEEVASGISNVAGRLTDLPVVGTIASTVNWASNLVAGVASVFGWSRPIDGSHSQPFTNMPARGFAHFKAKDSGTVLGMSNDNSVGEIQHNFISPEDEMSIDHICSRPGLIDVIDWNTSQDFNTTLGGLTASKTTYKNTLSASNISPVSYMEGDQVRASYIEDPTLAEYVIDQFRLYRADWHFRISLVKTAFHVGRLEIFFIPGKTPLGTFIGDLDTTNCYRQIFDITEQNEFEFVVPYMHRFVMMGKEYSAPSPGSTNINVEDPEVGSLYIRVNSPLTCPETVSQSVKILVWKYATNVSVAYPAPTNARPLLADTSIYPPRSARFQINVTNENKNVVYTVFNKSNTMEDNLEANQIVGGEMCVNLREATRAFRLNKSNIFERTEGNYRTFTLPNIIGWQTGGYLSICSNIYYFYRGGIAYKIFNPQTNSRLFSMLRYSNTGGDLTQNQDFFGSAPMHYTETSINPVHEIAIPYYSQTRRVVCNRLGQSGSSDFDFTVPYVTLFAPTVDSPVSPQVFSGAKDDLTFGFLVGVPVNLRIPVGGDVVT